MSEHVNLGNARDPEQLRKMQELLASGQCHFCREGFEKRHDAPIIYESKHWFITANNYPYKGSVHHYLLVAKPHIRRVTEILPEEASALFVAVFWLEQHLNVPGYSLFARSGDMSYTGATLEHLHFHFLVGDKKPEGATLKDNILVTLGHKKK